jgi:hypothetical protein
MSRICLLFLLVAVMLPASLHAEPITLTHNGRAAASIVVEANADPKVAQAAQDLRHYIAAISGVDLPLHTDGQAVQGVGIYIGKCATTNEGDLPPRGANPEAYAVRVRNGNVYIVAKHPTPTAFAVYDLIENDMGVRWFAPGELWEYVPPRVAGDYAIDIASRVVAPTTSPRIWSGHHWFDNWKLWNTRNKTDLSEVVPRRQFQNMLHDVLPPSKYAEEHPEYYPLVGGERWIPAEDYHNWRPCQTNPDVMRITVDYARKWLDENPTVDSFSVGMDDIYYVCGCDNCRALDPHPDSYEKKQFSDRYYKFVNEFARELAKTHPDRFVGTLIYHIARELPETVDKLEPNVFGFITERGALWWQPERREHDHYLTAEWAKRVNHLSRYDYFGMGTFTPRVYPHAMEEQIKFDKQHGFEGCYIEMYTFLPHTAPMIWSFSKLQWDHTLDIDALLGEFYAKMYGPAAPVMQRYFDTLEASWMENRPGRTKRWVHRNILAQGQSITPQAVDQCMALLDDAAVAADGDAKITRRIDIHRAALRFAAYAIKAQGLSEQLLNLKIDDAASNEQALKWVEAMSHLAAEREPYWQAAFDRDDLLGENLRGLRDKQYLQLGRVTLLETGSTAGTLRVLAWTSEHQPDRLPDVTRRLSQSIDGSVADTVRGWLYVQENKPANLLSNGDFEAAGANGDTVPSGWATWRSSGDTIFARQPGKGRHGSTAGAIADADSSSVYMQTVAAQPGEKYVVICWTKSDPFDVSASAKLMVRYRDDAGAWIKEDRFDASVSAIDGEPNWQPLILALTVPDSASQVVVMPSVTGGAKASALFDDVGVYRVDTAHE